MAQSTKVKEKEIKPMKSYNYDEFSTKDYEFDTVDGPDIGQKALDFRLMTTEGEREAFLNTPSITLF